MTSRATDPIAKPGPEPAMPFVLEALRRLSERRVPYCVLRNYHSLPHGLNGTDLDLLIEPEHLEAAARIVCDAAARHGGVCISRYRAEALITSFCGRTAGVWWGVQIDLFPGLTDRGAPFYDAGDLIRRSLDWQGIPVAPDGEADLIALLKELLRNSRSRKDYAKQAAAEYASDPASYDARLAGPFGPGALAAFRRYLQATDSAALMRTAARRLRWALRWRAFGRHPLRLLRTKALGMARRLRRLIRPPGIMLAVLGADGTGKSTLVARIQPVLAPALHGHVHVRHLRPRLLPALGRLRGDPNADAPVADPHARKPSGAVGSLFRLAYYTLDYLLGYWAAVYPSLVKRPTVWIFDRYFHDFLLDPLRMRVALPAWVVRAFAVAVPKPHIMVCLGARPDTIRHRKPELPPQELERQLALLRDICRRDTRAVWIDADGTAQDTADRVLSAVAERASARCQTR